MTKSVPINVFFYDRILNQLTAGKSVIRALLGGEIPAAFWVNGNTRLVEFVYSSQKSTKRRTEYVYIARLNPSLTMVLEDY